MAEVFEARHVALGHRVALKRLLPRFAARADVTARFLREGRATAALDHPHAVRVIDVDTHHGAPYLVMEFLDGEDLEALLHRRGRLALPEALALLLPVCEAVSAAHATGLVHRDLKPANLMIARTADGSLRPVVVDFGIARVTAAHTALTADDALLGTPAYLAPELCVGAANASPASDQYALAVTLYECLAGRLPFEADTLPQLLHAIVRGRYIPPDEAIADLPPGVSAVLQRALSREARDRFETVRAFADALLPFADARTRARFARDGAPADDAPEVSLETPSQKPIPTNPPPHTGGTLAPATRPSTRPAEPERTRALPLVALAVALACAALVALRRRSVDTPREARALRPAPAVVAPAPAVVARPAAPVEASSPVDDSSSTAAPARRSVVRPDPPARAVISRRPARVRVIGPNGVDLGL